MNAFYKSNKTVLTPAAYKIVYRDISPSFISSNIYDSLSIEKWLDEHVSSNSKIWYGTKVIFIPNVGISASDGGLTTYLFIDSGYKAGLGANWQATITTSYFAKKLYPFNSSYGKKEYEKYERMAGANVIIDDVSLREYFYTVLNKIESLDDKFDIEKITVEGIAFDLLALYQNIEKEDFLKIITTFLAQLSTFQGNQTYGGGKYKLKSTLNPFFYDQFDSLDLGSTKFRDYTIQNIITYIKSIKEAQITDINFIGMIPLDYLSMIFIKEI